MTLISACPRSSAKGVSSSARSDTVPSRLMTKTEFSSALAGALSLATMLASEIMNMMPAMIIKITMPQMVARVYLKNSFIKWSVFWVLLRKGTNFF